MKLLIIVFSTVLSYIGWWLGNKESLMFALFLSVIGGVAGVISAVWFYRRFIE
ncbi:hypothetical protein [Hippea jasoniae]|uniref:hypothetical protein n=1 Tax=Hippea jasoniae TaxID=944479 RepID=UPI000B21DFC2|nr:hypothetical protein [Hippea jasoniae]